MTRYECPPHPPQDAILWDRHMTPFAWERGLWKQVTGKAWTNSLAWEALFRLYAPLSTCQFEAAIDSFQIGETYLVRFADTRNMPTRQALQTIRDGDATIYEGVYSLDSFEQFSLTPTNESSVDIPFISGADLQGGNFFILSAEELVAIPKFYLRNLLAVEDDAVEEATQWYTEAYGKDITR